MFALGVSWGGLGLGGEKMEDSSDRARNGHQQSETGKASGANFQALVKARLHYFARRQALALRLTKSPKREFILHAQFTAAECK